MSKDVLGATLRTAVVENDVLGATLRTAVEENDVNWVELLLFHGADPSATDDQGETSLYLAAKMKRTGILMALLNFDDTNASLAVPTRQKDTVLHACLREGNKMTLCVQELVRRGADVCFPNMNDETPIDLALEFCWSRNIIDLLILRGHGMDFDRASCSVNTSLETVVHAAGKMYGRYLHETQERNVSRGQQSMHKVHGSLPLLFIQMGATQRLNKVLLYELNREAPSDCLLATLMEAFAYLPSLTELEHTVSIACGIEDHRRASLLVDADDYEARRSQLSWSAIRARNWNNALSRAVSSPRLGVNPSSLSSKKKELYNLCRKQVPTLAHLSCCTVRRTLKANVRQVVSLSIPRCMKEQILLGYLLRPWCGWNHDGEKSVPSDSSPDSWYPVLWDEST